MVKKKYNAYGWATSASVVGTSILVLMMMIGTVGAAVPTVDDSYSVNNAILRSEISKNRFDVNSLKYEHKPGELLVKYNKKLSKNDLENYYKLQNVALIKDYPGIGYHLIRVDESRLGKTIEALNKSDKFESAEPNYIVKAVRNPNDSHFDQLWAMNNTGQTGGTPDADIDAPEAWDISTGSKNVIVAVIDTGVDYTHEDLAKNMWTNPGEIPDNGLDDDSNGFVDDYYGWDFAYNDNDPTDGDSHGTHVSGTIGGVGNNGKGVAGVSWNVSIMAVKFLDDSSSGSTSDAISAINYANMMGADIMSNSWGGGGYSTPLKAAIRAADDAGILFVAAAGNSATNTDQNPQYPSCYDVPNVMSIAATDKNDNLASFSNYGNITVDLGAPGVAILSSVPGNGYSSFSGTSMAVPHVSGAAALLKSLNPSFTPYEIKKILMNSADPVPSLYGKTVTGGRLNIRKAVTIISTDPISRTVCPSGCDYTRIQAAIDAANPGDTIEVRSGTYYENVDVYKHVTLRGTGMPVVDARGVGSAIWLAVDGIRLEGFTATGGGYDPEFDSEAGIRVTSDNNILIGNNASNNHHGIYLYSSNNNTLSGNNASNNEDGISLFSSGMSVLKNNIMKGNRYNFGLYGSSNSDFDNQIDTTNLVDGKPVYYVKGAKNIVYDSYTNAGTFYCISCVNVTIKNLDLKTNRKGIFFWNTTRSKIQNVTASNNGIGIYLSSSSNNTLSGNNASNNNYGIQLDSSNNNTLSGNNASNNNGYGISLLNSSNNKIYHNHLHNTNQAYADSNNNLWDNSYPSGGNTWSDYTGVDLKSGPGQNIPGSDAIGDTPYNISGGAGAQDRYPLMDQIITGPVHNINKGTNYITIQAAINDSNPGDEIHVDNGTYFENVNVSKRLILRGIGMPVVDARGSGSAITLAADGIRLEGFTATGGGGSYYPDSGGDAGIKVTSNINTLISNNAYSNKWSGIGLWSSSNNTMSSSNVSRNENVGIILHSSSNNTLIGNNAFKNYDGIYLSSSNNNTLNHNIVSISARAITLDSSSNNTLIGNNADTMNCEGDCPSIVLYYSSHNNKIYNNIFNSTRNFYLYSSNINTWNITKQSGTNIIGGSYLGGNVWIKPDGTGFSQTCLDVNNTDGICDSVYALDSTNIDYLPLAYNTQPEIQITSDPGNQSYPDIHMNRIVWEDNRNGNWDIYMHDLSSASKKQITNNSANQWNAAIYGNRIVWEDERNGNPDIYMYDISTGMETQVTTNAANQAVPDIGGNGIVWHDDRNGNSDIYMYDFSTSSESRITTNSASQLFPAISGNRIVYEDNRNGNRDIYMYNLSTGLETQITTDTASQRVPGIDMNRIVWQDERNGRSDIYMYDILTGSETRITTDPANQTYPSISGDRIVYMDDRNGNYDIYTFDIPTGIETRITSNPALQRYPAISGNRIVWEDFRNGNRDIYMYNIASTLIPPGITTYPSSQTVNAGQNAIFSVVATGTAPLSYQWQKNGTNIPGATSASYTTPPTTMSDNGSTYRVNVTNSAGSVMSNSATLTVKTSINLIKNAGFESGTASWNWYASGGGTFTTPSPGYEGTKSARLALSNGGTNIQLYQDAITLEPNTRYRLSFAAYSNTGHDVKVNLIGIPYAQYGLSQTFYLGTNWQTNTTEFTTTGFTGTVSNGRLQFWLADFARAGDVYYIDDIRLEKAIAFEAPTITTHPSSQTVNAGQNATFSVAATGTAQLSYQWQKNGSNIPDATSASYMTPPTTMADSSSTYRVNVSNSAGSVMSNSATLTVKTSINLIKNPGFESGTTSWNWYASGGGTFTTPSPGYEGTKSARLALSNGGTNIQLYQDAITLEPNTRYRLSFAAYSNTGHDVKVNLIGIPYAPYGLSQTFYLGTNWQTNTTEFTTSGFTGTVSNGRLQFWLADFARSGDVYYIDDIRLEKAIAVEAPTITTQPSSQTVNAGQNATFSVVATGTAPLSYQWQKNGTNIPGATSASTPPTTISDNGSTYRVNVTNSAGSVMSNSATLTVISSFTAPTIITHPSDQIVNAGQTATFSVVATGSSPLIYQWQKNSVDIPGATGQSYTTQATVLSDSGSTYRVLVTNSAGSVTSNAATLTVNPATPPTNLIKNPGFESGTASWQFYSGGAGTFSLSSPGFGGSSNAAKLAFSNSGTNIQLYQDGITLEANTRYRLSFAAYSNTGHDVKVNLIGIPYAAYGLSLTFYLGTNWQTFTTEFTTKGFTGTVSNGRMQFWFADFARAGDVYYIDDVRLEKVQQ